MGYLHGGGRGGSSLYTKNCIGCGAEFSSAYHDHLRCPDCRATKEAQEAAEEAAEKAKVLANWERLAGKFPGVISFDAGTWRATIKIGSYAEDLDMDFGGGNFIDPRELKKALDEVPSNPWG